VDETAQAVGDLVGGWFPILDPIGWASNGQLWGVAPPGRRDPETWAKTVRATWLAWADAWRQLRGTRPVVTAVQVGPVKTADDTIEARDRARSWDEMTWGTLVSALRDGIIDVPGLATMEVPDLRDAADIVGVIYRGGVQVPAGGALTSWPPSERQPWVEGLVETMHRLAEELPDRPLMIAEHGVPTDDDEWRTELLRLTGDQLRTLRREGVPLVGYFHRGAVDGYEPHGGFETHWGLFDRDRNPHPSLQAFTALA
jgi:beta-glucosidase